MTALPYGVLDGPPGVTESFESHRARLGALSMPRSHADVIDVIGAAGLLGRGGAAFPAARKWHAVAERSHRGASILVNGAEGEPLSVKDRTLMTRRPHLVIDGALVAARAVGADDIVLYVGRDHRAARKALVDALRQRAVPIPVRFVDAPARYVAGEESAAVHFVNDADARPTTTPPRPFEQGIAKRPTLVQNVETLAYSALIARFGDRWYRQQGRGETPGSGLVTITSGHDSIVEEIELGTTVGEVAASVSTLSASDMQAVLVGGYFGGWIEAREAWDLALDPVSMRRAGPGFGCGVIAFLPHDRCGVRTTARIVDYMAGQSAAQCGPCVFGLRAIADATARIARNAAQPDDLARIERWSRQLVGRGACKHPDGAVGLLSSALRVFGDEFDMHQHRRSCSRHEASRVA
jgi:NADH:ubiquinone oxidoreductase subunit F (NADH-binding)